MERLDTVWLMWNAPKATFVCEPCILCDSNALMQRACLCECLHVPLSLSGRLRWGNWRSRWNAADISSRATDKSIKQHMKRHAQTKARILLGLNHPQRGLGCGSQGSAHPSEAFFSSLWKMKSAQKNKEFLKWVTHSLKYLHFTWQLV